MKEFVLYIKDGSIANRDGLERTLCLPDGKYRIQITRAGKRSISQNRYYHGVVVSMIREALKELGHELDHEEVHHWLKGKFNYVELVNETTGEYERVPISTTKLTTTLFMDYLEKIQRFASEFLGIVIPDPNQQSEIWNTIVCEYENDIKATVIKK